MSRKASEAPPTEGTRAAAPSLAVVIVNWNGQELLRDCIGSLLTAGYEPLRIVLVDNASADGSLAYVRGAFPSVEIVESPVNRRWAGGNNLGLRHLYADAAGPDYVLLLNNDTVVPEGSLQRLVGALAETPGAWAATPRICFADEPSRIWYDGGVVNRWSGWIHHDGIRQLAGRRSLRSRTVGYATGCAMLLSREAVAAVGDFDEDFHFYGEDADYSLRLRRAGGDILHVPAALVLHKVSMSVGRDSPRKAYLKSRSHVRLLRCHWPPSRWPLLVPSQLVYFAGLACWHLWGGRREMAHATLQGALDELSGRPLAPPKTGP